VYELGGITSPAFLAEIHHLLWTKPFKNRGQRDQGWSCRDHAAIAARILQALGIPSRVIFGKMMMCTGPTATDRPCGLEADPHAWNFIKELGHFDLSIRVPRSLWDEWTITAVAGSKVLADPMTHFAAVTAEQMYQQQVAIASNLENERILIYRSTHFAEAKSIPLEDLAKWIDSPLGVRLKEGLDTDPNIYSKAVCHLLLFISGERETLTNLSHSEAWKNVSQIPVARAHEVVRSQE
jgi:hypothetical protein